MRTATLFGYYGYDNLGDELLCEESIELLKQAKFDRIYLLMRKDKLKKFSRPQVFPIDRFNLLKVLGAILKSNVVVCGGGGIFQDQTSMKSLIYYASIVLTALMLGKPVLLLANSLGPLRHRFSKCLVRFILRRKNVFFISRDLVSHRYAKLIGGKNVFLGTDLAIGSIERLPVCEKQKKISLCLKKVVKLDLLVEMAKIYNFELVLVPLSPQDETVCDKMANEYKLPVSKKPLEDLVSSSLVVSHRFHGCLIACLVGSPFVLLNSSKGRRFFERYFPKYEGFCSREDPTEIVVTFTKLKDSKLDSKKMVEDFDKMRQDVIELLKSLVR